MHVNGPDTGLVYGCITHVPLWLEFPSFVTPIYLGQSQGEGRLNLRDLAPEWERHHPVIGGSAGSFALRNYVLKHHPSATRIGICQYRKFISRRRISFCPEPTYPVMDVVYRGLLTKGVVEDVMHPGDRAFLVSKTFPFGKRRKRIGLLEQYKSTHHVEDFLRFTAAAVELGVLDKDEVTPFFHELTFFPGGIELGVYEASFWLKGMGDIEAVMRLCIEQYPAHRDAYQTRAWSFCAERLGSYLLLKHLRSIAPPQNWIARLVGMQKVPSDKRCIGQMNVITERDGAGYTLGTSGPGT